jgi:type I restriction enzyme R subunit
VTVEDVLLTLEGRLRAKLSRGERTHPVWRSLSERLEALRRSKLDSAAASVEFLKQLLDLATDLVEAEKADTEGRLEEMTVIDRTVGR